jgi:hypothetical protein
MNKMERKPTTPVCTSTPSSSGSGGKGRKAIGRLDNNNLIKLKVKVRSFALIRSDRIISQHSSLSLHWDDDLTIYYAFRFIMYSLVETEPNRYSQLSCDATTKRNSRTHRIFFFFFFFSSRAGNDDFFFFFSSHHNLLPVAAARLSSCCCCRPVRRFNTPISGSPPLLMEFKFRLWRQKRADVAPRIIWSELLLYFSPQKIYAAAAAALWCECLAFLYDPIRVHNEIIYLGDGIVSSFRFSLRFFSFFSFFSPSCKTIRRLINCDHGGLSCCFNIHFLLCVSARPCSSSPCFSRPKMKWRAEGTKKGQKESNQINAPRRCWGRKREFYVCTAYHSRLDMRSRWRRALRGRRAIPNE